MSTVVSKEISLGNLINLGTVLIAVITLWIGHQKDMEIAYRQNEDQQNAIKALGERVADLSERMQALSLGNTQRFTALDDGISMLSKRLDSLSTVIQAQGDRLTIQEAKTQALQDELKTFTSKHYQ